jgi:RNA polymerase sigma factor (sigma-70 family)
MLSKSNPYRSPLPLEAWMPDTSNDSVRRSIAELDSDREAAERKLFEQFYPCLIAAISRRRKDLGVDDRGESTADAAMSAFIDLSKGVASGRFHPLDEPRQFMAILMTIANEKVIHQRRRQNRKKRNPRRVLDEARLAQIAGDEDMIALDQFAAEEPSAESKAEIRGEIFRIREALDDEGLRQVFDLMLEGFTKSPDGYTNDEIAAQIDRSGRTVQRRIQRIISIASQLEDQ